MRVWESWLRGASMGEGLALQRVGVGLLLSGPPDAASAQAETRLSLRDGKLWWGKWWLEPDAVQGTTLAWKKVGATPVWSARRVPEVAGRSVSGVSGRSQLWF